MTGLVVGTASNISFVEMEDDHLEPSAEFIVILADMQYRYNHLGQPVKDAVTETVRMELSLAGVNTMSSTLLQLQDQMNESAEEINSAIRAGRAIIGEGLDDVG